MEFNGLQAYPGPREGGDQASPNPVSTFSSLSKLLRPMPSLNPYSMLFPSNYQPHVALVYCYRGLLSPLQASVSVVKCAIGAGSFLFFSSFTPSFSLSLTRLLLPALCFPNGWCIRLLLPYHPPRHLVRLHAVPAGLLRTQSHSPCKPAEARSDSKHTQNTTRTTTTK